MLAMHGYEDDAIEQVISLGLLDMHSGEAEVFYGGSLPEEREWFELTEMGKDIMRAVANK